MIELNVYNGNIEVYKPETITTGRVGHKVYVKFDNKWDGLTHRVATFKAGNLSKKVILGDITETNDTIVHIPVQVLKTAGDKLEVGFKGFNKNMNKILPTKYVSLGYIHQGSEILEPESIHMIQDAVEHDEDFQLRIATEQEIDEMLNYVFGKGDDEPEQQPEEETE